jgi:hypothetical protein
MTIWTGPDAADDDLPDLGPAEDGVPLVDQREADSALEAVMQVEEAAAGEVLAVVHEDGHVVPGGGQLQDLEPDDQVMLGVDCAKKSEA